MEMNIGDMVAAMAARNEAFRGNEQVPEKVEAYNKLKEHAAAIARVLRAPWYADDLELRWVFWPRRCPTVWRSWRCASCRRRPTACS